MDNIRLKKGIEVSVNDNEDVIVIDAEDQLFVDKFYGLIEKMDNVSAEIQSKEISALGAREQIRFSIEKTREIMAGIDELFGEDACKKVFGDIVPHPYLIADFFEQMTPIVEKHMNERQKELSQKYKNRQQKRADKKKPVR